jgi:hypothetical protein
MKGWLPQNSNIPSFYCDTEEFREEGVLLMLQTDEEYMLNLRISPQRVEKLLLSRIPKVAKDAYIDYHIFIDSSNPSKCKFKCRTIDSDS